MQCFGDGNVERGAQPLGGGEIELAEAIGRSIFYEDLGNAVAGEEGLAAVTERVAALIKERRPGIIAIDSFKALAAFADDARVFRRFLHELAAVLTAYPATSFWIGEYSENETRSAPEFAVADGIISLATERASERTLRLIQVTKLRGSDFRSGRHAYRLSGDGITVFPRLSIRSATMATGWPKRGSRPVSHRSTGCSPRATRPAAPRSWPDHRVPARP